MVKEIVDAVFSLVEAQNYLNNTSTLLQAINLANSQLYMQTRDNFGTTQEATDYLQEFYMVYDQNVIVPYVIQNNSTDGYQIDVVKQIEVCYDGTNEWVATKDLPDNNFDILKRYRVGGPTKKRPISRLEKQFTYEILPTGLTAIRARVLIIPPNAEFTLEANGTPLPTVNVIKDLLWTPEKLSALVGKTLSNLHLTVSSGMMNAFGQQLQ